MNKITKITSLTDPAKGQITASGCKWDPAKKCGTASTGEMASAALGAGQNKRKPVIESESRILNPDSGFAPKLLCTGPTFTAGTACAYSCTYCYVEAMVGTKPFVTRLLHGQKFRDVVIRRRDSVNRLRKELRNGQGLLKYN